MPSGIQKYRAHESLNVSMGQGGCIFEVGTDPVTGNIVAIQFLADSTFTTLTPRSASFIGTAGGAGDSVTGSTFPKGVTVFGDWTTFTLATGSAIAYIG